MMSSDIEDRRGLHLAVNLSHRVVPVGHVEQLFDAMHDGALESTGAAVLAQKTMEQAKHRGGLYSMPRPLGKPCAAALDGIIL
jgi:hypothetical protein